MAGVVYLYICQGQTLANSEHKVTVQAAQHVSTHELSMINPRSSVIRKAQRAENKLNVDDGR